jgi:hypothetical protein
MPKKKYLFRILSLALSICMIMQIATPVLANSNNSQIVTINGLQTDYTTNPLGIDNKTPKFSWKLASDARSVMQQAYQIGVSSSPEKLASGDYDVWNSQKQQSNESVGIIYGGIALQSSTRYYWKVTVWDNKDNQLVSQEQAWFETGLLNNSDWTAKWINLDTTKPTPSKYSIDFDFRIIKDDAGFIFAAKDTSNFLMWQMNTFEKKFNGALSFRPHQWVNGSASVLTEIPISETIIPVTAYHTQHHMQILVDGTTVTTLVDDQQIDTRTCNYAAFGKMGFRQSYVAGDCDEQAGYDNFVVKDGSGAVLFSDDFSSGVNTSFDVGTVTNQELVVVNALGLQKDSSSAAPMYRRQFNVQNNVKSARVYTTALGLYQMEINGKQVGNDYFNPGWTAYELNPLPENNYVMYQTYDVTSMLNSGENVIGAITGHGWYSGKLFVGGNNRYGTGSKLSCQLEILYENGDKDVISTDGTWKVSGNGPIISDDIQNGEIYNATHEMAGWSQPNYTEDASWKAASVSSYDGRVIAQIGPTVKPIKEFKPIKVTSPSTGTYIFDLGQNIAGVARMNVKGTAGTTVQLRFGEMLNSNGSLYVDNLRSAKATDYYTLSGNLTGETYQPRFTYHGFRYIEVTNYPGIPTLDDITGVALSSLQEQTGTFDTSNQTINQLQSNITWGQKDNFISVPTDCPQRDERLGYTGDGQVFARTAVMNMNTDQFYTKFMKDIISNQRSDGAIADWTPNYVTAGDGMSGSFGNTGWGDAVVIIPWTMYTTYGDKSAISDNYTAMKKWVDRYRTLSGTGLVLTSTIYGDWLSIDADTPKDVISTAYFAYCADLLSKMAKAIGQDADATYYAQLFQNICIAFNTAFVTADGQVKGQTQTSYLLALKFNLLPTPELKAKVAANLVADIKAKNMHLSTGFIGVAYLCPMLSEMGYGDIAYQLLLQDTYPSWMYSVDSGATTIWERWNSYNSETGQFGDASMNSFNHYSLGSVGEWFYNYVAGIQYDKNIPAYKHSIIQPIPGGGLSYVNSSFDSVYGKITSNWRYENTDTFVMETTIPANTTATISVPAISIDTVTEGGIDATKAEGLTFVKMENGKAIFEAGSGSYVFRSKVERKVLLSVKDKNPKAPSVISIDGGVAQKLPLAVEVTVGSKLNLTVSPLNDIDYTFGFWSGAVVSDKSTISVTVQDNTDLLVNNVSTGYIDIALNAAVTAKNNDGGAPTWLTSNLTNGDTTSAGGYTSISSGNADISANPFWVEIDLGKNSDFDVLHLYPRQDSNTASGLAGSFPKNFKIEIRKDGESNYTTVKELTNQTTTSIKPIVLTLDQIQNARYIRLTATVLGDMPTTDTTYRLQLAEMGIYKESDKVVPNIETQIAKVVEDLITALPVSSSATVSNEASIRLAESAYNALTSNEKALVDNYTKLQSLISLADSWDIAAAQPVIDAITALPSVANVILTDETAVNTANASYGNLTTDQKALVTNYSKVTDLLAKLVILKKNATDLAAAQPVIDAINLLPSVANVTLTDETAVNTANSSYGNLTTDPKALVTNYSKVTDLLAKLVILKKNATDLAAAQPVIDAINLLPTVANVTLTDETAVNTANSSYGNLTTDPKSLVTNYSKVTDLLAKLVILKKNATDLAAAQPVFVAINALPSLTNVKITDETAVNAANASYGTLTTDQKALVTNYSKVSDLLAKLVILKKNATDSAASQAVIDAINALPSVANVKITDETAVNAANASYGTLTADQKTLVTNYTNIATLKSKIATLKDQLAADTVVAKVVIDAINVLPSVENVKITDETAVNAANASYATLTTDQKALVTNYTNIATLKSKIAALKDQQTADTDAAKAVIDRINSLSSHITLSDKLAVEEIIVAYGSLTPVQKLLVTNYAVILNAQTTIKSLESTSSNTIPTVPVPNTGNNGIIPLFALIAGSFGSLVFIKKRKNKKNS